MYDGWMWWMPFHGVLSLLIIAAVVVGIIVLVRLLWPSNSNSAGNGSARRSGALDLLDERYARGELDRDEYLQRKRDLSAR